MQAFKTIDDYIQSFPKEVRVLLEQMRQTIHAAAPEAAEAIRYQMPTFRLKNKNLVHFAGYKNHIGFYPTPSGILAFQKDLAPYSQGKGSIQFPLDQPIPYDLVRKVTVFRRKESLNAG